ncbi:MAG: hypothetical protein AB1813_14765, partial [Verrucomicrobiota bacterium]
LVANNPVSLVVTTSGGLNAGGFSSNGSGGSVNLTAGGNLEMMGTIVSGGSRVLDFDTDGDLLGEHIVWGNQPSTVRVQAAGRAFIGGNTLNAQNEIVETGGYIRASQRVEILGGTHPSDVGVLVHAVSEISTQNLNGSIDIQSDADAHVFGLLAAGGEVETIRDGDGVFLGRRIHWFGGASTIRIQAAHQARIGLELQAGLSIDVVGGIDPVEPDPAQGLNLSGRGIVVLGSGQLLTLLPNSQINLNAPGRLDILAPAHTNQIEPLGWIGNANGRLSSDVALDLYIDKVDFAVQGRALLSAAATADNQGIADLVTDLQVALEAAALSIVSSTNPNRQVGAAYTELADDPASAGIVDPDLKIKLKNGKLLFTGPYRFQIQNTSVNAGLLGLDTTATLHSGLFYAVQADQPGSTVSIGAPSGPNGKLYIAAQVVAYNTINLYSGNSPDGIDIDLEATGVLETIDGSIGFSAGVNAIVRGDVLARGAGSDVNLSASQSLTLQGRIEANDQVVITAGTEIVAGRTSVRIDPTSQIQTAGAGGTIVIRGVNDVVIDGFVGHGNPNIALIDLEATSGTLTLAAGSGQVQSAGLLLFTGHGVEINGVVDSSYLTANAVDFETQINADDFARITGDVEVTGSLEVNAGNLVEIYNSTIRLTSAGQQLVIDSDGDVQIGAILGSGNDRIQAGALLAVPARIEITAAGLVEVAAGVQLLTSEAGSSIEITADQISVIGVVHAGATLNAQNQIVWSGANTTLDLDAGDLITLGGAAVDSNGQDTQVGGSLLASRSIALSVSGGSSAVDLNVSALSFIRSDATGAGAFTAASPSSIAISTAKDVLIYGLVDSSDAGSDVTLNSGGLVLVDGFVSAQDQLIISGGASASNVSILVTALVLGAPDQNGNPQRVSGGTLNTGNGGNITLSGTQTILLSGTVGQPRLVGASIIADVTDLRVTTTGDVFVDGDVNVSRSIDFSGANISVLAGGRIKGRSANVTATFTAPTGAVLLAGAQDGLDAALVEVAGQVQILGTVIRVDGSLINNGIGSPVFFNAVSNLIVTGTVTAFGSMYFYAGVNAAWSGAQLVRTDLATTDLVGGDIRISGAARVDASGNIRFVSGYDVTLDAAAGMGNGQVNVPVPLITQTPTTVSVITGQRQVANGFILVPEVRWIPTQVIDQVGTEQVRIGTIFHTFEVTLTQDGYYNPNAAPANRIREFFIENIDYYNNTTGPSNVPGAAGFLDAGIPVINWAAFNVAAPATDATWNQINDAQRNAVLATLGYKRLYNFSFASPQEYRVINGVPTVTPWTPPWVNRPLVIVNMPHPGLDDKYIRLPDGAQLDVLRSVSQGEPVIFEETVGSYHDIGRVLYTQIYSDQLDRNYSSGGIDYREIDFDNQPSRWQVSYVNNGQRVFNINDGRSNQQFRLVPLWYGQQLENGVDVLNRRVYSPQGFLAGTPGTQTIQNQLEVSSSLETVGRREYFGYAVQILWVSFTGYYDSDEIGEGEEEYTISGLILLAGNISFFGGDFDGADGSTWFIFSNASSRISGLKPTEVLLISASAHERDSGLIGPNDNLGSGSFFGNIPTSSTFYNIGNSNFNAQFLALAEGSGWEFDQNLTETFRNYHFDWASRALPISDTRRILKYQWVSTPTDIFGIRPKYETFDTQVKVVDYKPVTRWLTELITQDQLVFLTSRIYDQGTARDFGTFGQDTIRASGQISLDGGRDILLQGIVNAYGTDSLLTVNAGRDLLLNGVLPAGATDPLTLPARSELKATSLVTLNAAEELAVTSSGYISVNGGSASALGRVSLTSGTSLTFDGEIFASKEALLRANDDITVRGVINAGHLIDIDAGLDGTGNVIGDIYTDLNTLNSEINISAGALWGDILLPNSSIATLGTLNLNAPSGLIAHSGGILGANTLNATASFGFAANTAATFLNVTLSSAGDISIVNQGDTTLQNILAPNGSISIAVLGSLHAQNVRSLGGGDEDDITLLTYPKTSGVAVVTFDYIEAAGQGDINVLLQRGIFNSAGIMVADQLNLTVPGGFALTPQTNALSIVATTPGDITINRPSTAPLYIEKVTAVSGAVRITTGGDLTVGEIRILTNLEENDIVLTSGGSIDAGPLIAGFYAATQAELDAYRLELLNAALRAVNYLAPNAPDLNLAEAQALPLEPARSLIEALLLTLGLSPAQAASDALEIVTLTRTFTSLGDITVTATGTVRIQSEDEDDLDLIGDEIRITGASVNALDVSGNTLAELTVQSGDVVINDFDGAGERSAGLQGLNIHAVAGSVTIHSLDSIEIVRILAPAPNADVTINTDAGGVVILPRAGGEATITAGRYVRINAPDVIEISGGIVAPQGIQLSSTKLVFLTSGGLVAEDVTFEGDASFVVDADLRATRNLTLISNAGNITIMDGLDGISAPLLETVKLVARGNRITEGVAAGYYQYRNTANGEIYYKDSPIENQGGLFQLVNGALVAVSGGAGLDLVPVLQLVYKVVKDSRTGYELFVDSTGLMYTKELGSDTLYNWQDPVTRRFRYWAYNAETLQTEVFYSTTQEPGLGTMYYYDNVRIVADQSVFTWTPYYTVAAGSPVLTPILTPELAGNIYFNNPGTVAAVQSIEMEAFGGVVGANPAWYSSGNEIVAKGADGVVKITAGRDPSLAPFTIRANQLVDINIGRSSTLDGAIHGGNLVINTGIVGYSRTIDNIIGAADNDLTVATNTTSSNSITLSAGRFITTQPAVTLTTNTLTTTAGSNINIKTAVTTLDGAITGSGTLTVNEADAIHVRNLTNASGNAQLTAGGNITTTRFETSGTMTITSTGGNITGQGIRAATLTLQAQTGIGGGAPLLTAASTLTVNTAFGDLTLHNTANGQVLVTNLSSSNGNIRFRQTGSDRTTVQNVSIAATDLLLELQSGLGSELVTGTIATPRNAALVSTGHLNLTGAINLAGQNGTNTAGLTLETGANISFNSTVTTNGAHVRLAAGADVSLR